MKNIVTVVVVALVLTGCGRWADRTYDKDGNIVAPSTPLPAATTTTVAPSVAPSKTVKLDPRFDTCVAAKKAGFGPYERGSDVEYAWYTDRDGDGLVCV